ncbi:putative metal chaperone, involved in Zn homeostasis, GTPase of COG0523 family [Dehalobacter sp. UNSWDHB]|jgi:Putative GTPases (G3E family)|uniref:GTP-binding protein n=1 Tax=unclassified Dehalobacter TaxID=2635733 RepID=UPI00028A7E59|nr:MULTISPECIES: GTP-binding protein [unclassified Dehalobacter]AFV03041.1 Putative metal chaperone, involved in Zn homeostasis, GTPase of COG0523 family [Dehalobacter sp. DCA]AFV06029.1 Putative metal chaperone, involved in Zn homeostasis, GTPase of COG0523 family [Dehalobacter sp. CF]EQB22181.1 putative metal chaperone, involved in Zn homeostasis, GTPase of COG0523 family [Dehalobacter sp. UNSWDHB]
MQVIILGGFLGSGKTTLLLSLAHYIVSYDQDKKEENGVSLAIIENEIGEISIDDKTLQSGGYDVSTLFSGCICCTLVSDLLICVHDISRKIKPSWIIIETTGLAYPDRVAEALREYCKKFKKLSVQVIVDAERWEELSEIMQPLIHGQIAKADGVLLNKTDLVDHHRIVQIEKSIAEINDRARVFKVSGLKGIDDEVWKSVLSLGKEMPDGQ